MHQMDRYTPWCFGNRLQELELNALSSTQVGASLSPHSTSSEPVEKWRKGISPQPMMRRWTMRILARPLVY